MRARPLLAAGAVLVLLTVSAALLSRGAAHAGPDPQEASLGHTFDIRMVQVLTPTPEGIEQPCPILSGSDTTTDLPWPRLLGLLKKRGATLVLMDQRITSAPGTLAKAFEELQVPVLLTQSRTLRGAGEVAENQAAARYRSGCKADLVVGDRGGAGAWLSYKLESRGVSHSTSQIAEGATETLRAWEGAHRVFPGRTLVLTHRRQVRVPGSSLVQGVELYCLLSMRVSPAR